MPKSDYDHTKALRQQRLRERRKQGGYTQKRYWLTTDEAAKVEKFIALLRAK